MKIGYCGIVIRLRPFLAFYGPKKAVFAIRGTKYSILKQKTCSKMEQPLPDYAFWYCPSDDNHLQWLGHDFMAIFSLLWPKKAIFATRGTKYSILKQKHGQKWSTLYQTMYFDTDLQIKLVFSGFVIILWQFLAFYGPKMLLLQLGAQNTQFWNSKHGKKNGANSTRLFVLILPFRWTLFPVNWY